MPREIVVPPVWKWLRDVYHNQGIHLDFRYSLLLWNKLRHLVRADGPGNVREEPKFIYDLSVRAHSKLVCTHKSCWYFGCVGVKRPSNPQTRNPWPRLFALSKWKIGKMTRHTLAKTKDTHSQALPSRVPPGENLTAATARRWYPQIVLRW